MKNDTSFDSEAGSSDSDKEIIVKKEEEKQNKNLDLIKSINKTLTTALEENKKLSDYKEILIKQGKMCFSSSSLPNISLFDYLRRIDKYSFLDKNTLILSVIYVDRISKFGNIILTNYNIHRIIFAAILLAIKYNEDEFYDNKYYAEIAGITPSELINIEYMFFCICNFNLYVDDDTFNNYSQYLTNFNK